MALEQAGFNLRQGSATVIGYLEMTNTDENFTATLVLNLRKPTGGKAAAN